MGVRALKAVKWRIALTLPMLVLASGIAEATCSVYEHANYQGWRRDLGGGVRWNYIGDRYNDKVSSVRVANGCTFIAFQHRDLGGWSRSYDKDTPYVGNDVNDQISSGRCVCKVVVAPSTSLPQLVNNVMNGVLQANRGRFQVLLRDEINGLEIQKGYQLYEAAVSIGTLNTQMTGPRSFVVTLNNNTIRAKSRTPNVLGSYADPGFQITFNLRMEGLIAPPTGGAKMRMQTLVANVPTATVRGTNVAGAVVTAAVAVFQMTGPGGRKIQSVAQRALVIDLTNRINTELAKL